MKDIKEKKTPAQRFGEETAEAFFGPAGSDGIRSDTLGSYTGDGMSETERASDDTEFAFPRLSPGYSRLETMGGPWPIETPVQDADDL